MRLATFYRMNFDSVLALVKVKGLEGYGLSLAQKLRVLADEPLQVGAVKVYPVGQPAGAEGKAVGRRRPVLKLVKRYVPANHLPHRVVIDWFAKLALKKSL